VHPGPHQTPASIHGEIARRPDRRRADVGGEDGIVGGGLAEQARQILRMYRLVPWGAARQFIEAGPRFFVMGNAVIEMIALALRRQLRQ
jgi:hypothetical protein